jgi:flagellar motor component MotA
MIGAFFSLIFACVMCGVHIVELFVPSSIIGVFGMTMSGLLATHGTIAFRFVLRCIAGCFVHVEPDDTFSEIAANARVYSMGSGWIMAAMHVIRMMTIWDADELVVAGELARAMAGIIIGIYLSVFVFGHFQRVLKVQRKWKKSVRSSGKRFVRR